MNAAIIQTLQSLSDGHQLVTISTLAGQFTGEIDEVYKHAITLTTKNYGSYMQIALDAVIAVEWGF